MGYNGLSLAFSGRSRSLTSHLPSHLTPLRMVCEQLFGGDIRFERCLCSASKGTMFLLRFRLRFEKRYDWFKDCGDKEVLKESRISQTCPVIDCDGRC